jgi:hypothetical protein
MKVTYSFQLFARCPSDHEPDVYDVTVESTRTILCEHLNAAAAEIGGATKHLAQEEITVQLARRFAARVTTRGCHYGVHTVVEA